MTVPDLLDLVEEFRSAGQLEPIRLANAANNDIGLLREAVKAAHKKETDYQSAAKKAQGGVDGSGDLTAAYKRYKQELDVQTGLADVWNKNTVGLTAAVGLVLDRPQPAPSARATTPTRPQHPEGTRLLAVELAVHLESATWHGQLRVQALPPIGSGLRLDAGHLLRISDLEMDLNGTFTVHAEVAPAAPTLSRGLLTKLGLTQDIQ